MSYASGKYAYFICDVCGFRYRYTNARMTWDNSKVCRECYEPKHPQLEPLRAKADPEALYKPRPNNDQEEGEGFVVVVNSNIFKPDYLNPSTLPENFEVAKMTASVGEVTIVIS